jgi:hypothetical protein
MKWKRSGASLQGQHGLGQGTHSGPSFLYPQNETIMKENLWGAKSLQCYIVLWHYDRVKMEEWSLPPKLIFLSDWWVMNTHFGYSLHWLSCPLLEIKVNPNHVSKTMCLMRGVCFTKSGVGPCGKTPAGSLSLFISLLLHLKDNTVRTPVQALCISTLGTICLCFCVHFKPKVWPVCFCPTALQDASCSGKPHQASAS